MESPLIISFNNKKSNKFNPLSISPPHMLAFHLAWTSLFSNFFSTFSIPPLLPLIRIDLNLTPNDVANAGVASFAGSVLSRLAMGPICDIIGPRIAISTFSFITAPAVLAASFITSSGHFIVIRFLIGFSLANFVACQFWMSSMFSSEVVGVANGVAAGWANVGSGFTQLIMPLIYSFFLHVVSLSSSSAWRIAFVVPACFQIVTGVVVLVYGQDLPSGRYERTRRRQKTGEDSKTGDNGFSILLNGLKDYRGWILGLTYGFCFGVELTVDNIIAQYFYDRFSLNIETAGAIAACFGLANVASRPMGGILSDALGRRFGIRGRLWGLWAVQSLAGLMCFGLGRVGSLWGSILVMCGFSFLVQAASGLTFGVVPFVSKRYLGVISGMTGSGGTLGAVVTQLLLFSGSSASTMSTQSSISHMGILMIICTLPVTLLYFPGSGGMFCGPAKQPDPIEDDYNMLE